MNNIIMNKTYQQLHYNTELFSFSLNYQAPIHSKKSLQREGKKKKKKKKKEEKKEKKKKKKKEEEFLE